MEDELMKFLYYFEIHCYYAQSLQFLRFYEPFKRTSRNDHVREIRSRIDKFHMRYPIRFKSENRIMWW